MIIVNPSSGEEKSSLFIDDTENMLMTMGYQVTVKETKKESDAEKFAVEACEKKVHIVSVMGGDGTVNEVLSGIAEKEYRPVIHIIPLGTVNNFAKALDIPLKPKEAIQVLENPVERITDIGKINNTYFINLVNLGAIAEATYEVTSEQKSKLGSLAYFMEGVKQYTKQDTFIVTVEYENEVKQLEAMLVLTTVTDTIAGLQHVMREVNPDDGYLHVFVIKQISGFDSVSMLSNLWNGMLKDHQQVAYYKAKSIKIDTNPKKVANIDGDEGYPTPLSLSILEKHIKVLSQKN